MSKYTKAINELCDAARAFHEKAAEASREIKAFEKEMIEAGVDFDIWQSGTLKWGRPLGESGERTVLVSMGNRERKPWYECDEETWPGIASQLIKIVEWGREERRRLLEWKP